MDELLSLTEHNRLAELEQTIEAGLQTFVEVGLALREVRDSRLYRVTHGRFEDYCKERWQIERRRAYQLIDAAGVAENVNPGSQIGEKHIRPLTSLPPEVQREVWQKSVETAPNGKVTAAHVEKVAKAYKPQEVEETYADDDAVVLDEEEQRNAYFFGLYQEGHRLYNQWIDAETPETRKQYRKQLFDLMVKIDQERGTHA
jgi:hypothetical protein